MRDITDTNISRQVEHIEQDRRIKAIYGHIIDVLNMNDNPYYIVLVGPEETYYPVDTQCEYIPLEESPSRLAAAYGEPSELIGLRVRVEYYGMRWRTGVARIVSGRNPEPTGNLTEVPTRGFRFAVAGGGSV